MSCGPAEYLVHTILPSDKTQMMLVNSKPSHIGCCTCQAFRKPALHCFMLLHCALCAIPKGTSLRFDSPEAHARTAGQPLKQLDLLTVLAGQAQLQTGTMRQHDGKLHQPA